jgi:sterol desaturase/sphingolipid hydroxylase (fatty acid hydroxylase superfamily)
VDKALIIYFAIPFFIISMIIESLYAKKKKQDSYEIKDTAASISMGIGNVLIALIAKLIVVPFYYFIYEYRLFTIEASIIAWIALLFLDDFCYYWAHRFGHVSRLFWASHIIHHSSQRYNLSTALRQTWTGGFFTFIFYTPLAIIGFHPLMMLTMQAVNLLYQFWIHTEFVKSIGFLESFMNSPSHHRVHHGSDIKYLDKNYAGIFIIWDKLFDTFKKEEERPKYGILHNIQTYNPLKIASHEWISIFNDLKTSRSLKEFIAYIFAAPGWSPDGSRKTSKQLQLEIQTDL